MLLNEVTHEFLTALQKDAHLIQSTAFHLFYYLVIIQLSLSALTLVLIGEPLLSFTTKMIKLAVVFSGFYSLIAYGGEWIPDMLNGFIEIGQQSGIHSLNPSAIINQGVNISSAILKGFFNWGLLAHPFVSFIGATVCVTVIIIYAFIAAELVIVLVKTYILISLSSLFFAFGATDITRAMTRNYIQSTIGIGLNLMTLYLLIGVGQQVGSRWADMTAHASEHHELMPMLVILAAVIVYYMIIKNIPAFIAGLSGIRGFRNYGTTAAAMMLNTGMQGGSMLLQSARTLGRGIQGTAQGIKMAHSSWQGFYQGFQAAGGGWSGVVSGAQHLAGHMGSAIVKTVKDSAMKKNTKFSAAEKFNHHLASRIDSKSSKRN